MVLTSVLPFISLISFQSVSPVTINGESAYNIDFYQSYSLASSAIGTSANEPFEGCYSYMVLDVVYSSYFYPARQKTSDQLKIYGITFKADKDYTPYYQSDYDGDAFGWLPSDGILATTYFDGVNVSTGEGAQNISTSYRLSVTFTTNSLHIDFHNSQVEQGDAFNDTIQRYWSVYDGSNSEMIPSSSNDKGLIDSFDFKAATGFGYQSHFEGFGFSSPSPDSFYTESLNAIKDRVGGASYNDGYRDGFSKGKEEALSEGSAVAGSVDNVFSLFGKAFASVADFFEIKVFGFLPLYWFFLAPIIAMIIAVIVKLV